jgi:NADPH:quinone reductase-like Zn-dependent oxidoreductase
VKPVVDWIFSTRYAEEAHRYLRDGRHFGKIVLTWQEMGPEYPI